MLRLDFLEPMGITSYRLAKSIGVLATRSGDILHARRDTSPETGVLFDAFFGLSSGYWGRIQADYDARKAGRVLAERLSHISPVLSSTASRSG
jgi:addiction module HigA family antidote